MLAGSNRFDRTADQLVGVSLRGGPALWRFVCGDKREVRARFAGGRPDPASTATVPGEPGDVVVADLRRPRLRFDPVTGLTRRPLTTPRGRRSPLGRHGEAAVAVLDRDPAVLVRRQHLHAERPQPGHGARRRVAVVVVDARRWRSPAARGSRRGTSGPAATSRGAGTLSTSACRSAPAATIAS